MNNISDKEAMHKLYEKLHGKEPLDKVSANSIWKFKYKNFCEGYECCLSEFEQVAQCYVNNDGECEVIEYTGSMEQWDDDFTPLYTRKG